MSQVLSLRTFFLVSVTLGVTVAGVMATDTLSTDTQCPLGMVPVNDMTFTCIDRYEVSPSSDCPVADTQTEFDTDRNLQIRNCHGVSVSSALPWRYVSREDAMAICARSGKQLPTAAQWYSAALGSTDTACNLDGAIAITGAFSTCASPIGTYDQVGNVWEWVRDDVSYGYYNGRILPTSGYITQVDSSGVAVTTATSTEFATDFASDYHWLDSSRMTGMMRGGFYGSGSDGGVYALSSNQVPTFASAGIGFRCSK
jgi:formylglycine-generating enzyme required for sulfatase activity